MSNVLQDLRYGARSLMKSRGFTAIALATLALGIGGNAAIFSFVNAVLLKPLPYAEPERIVRVLERRPDGGTNGIAALNYLDWVRDNTVFESIAAWTYDRVSPSYFQIFGIQAALGRTFAPEEDVLGKNRVVVLGHDRWQTEFGGDRGIIGRSILVDGEAHTIIGVLPPGRALVHGSREQTWRPLAFAPQDMSRTGSFFGAFARLRRGVTIEQARAQMEAIGQRIAQDYPDARKGWSVAVDSYADTIVSRELRRSLYVLLAAVGMVLLIACANLANLSLTRGLAREREVAIRASLGASRGRLFRQFLTESVLLSAIGGVLGLALGYAMMQALKLALPPFWLPREVDVTMDGRVLGVTLLLTLITGVICGLFPALQAARLNLAHAMTQGSAGTGTNRARQRVRTGLIVAEIAIAFVSLTGAGLLLRSFAQLQKVELGFDPTNVVTAVIPISAQRLETGESLNAYLREIQEAVAAIPGVRDVAVASRPPLAMSFGYGFRRADDDLKDPMARHGAFLKMVSPSYFRTLGIRVIRGRGLTEHDVGGSLRVAVINETLANAHFRDKDPIGKRLLIPELIYGKKGAGQEIAWEVVGVIANERVDPLEAKNLTAGVYMTTSQSPTTYQSLLVRGTMDRAPLQEAIRKAVRAVDQDLTLSNMTTLDQIKSESLADKRLRSVLLGIFASVALLLAAIGLYGVISHGVEQRTREIGIRAALGATPVAILKLILRGGLMMVVLGILIGVAGTFAATGVLSSLLFGVGERDALTFAAVIILFATIAFFACYVPARRAMSVNPIVALRWE